MFTLALLLVLAAVAAAAQTVDLNSVSSITHANAQDNYNNEYINERTLTEQEIVDLNENAAQIIDEYAEARNHADVHTGTLAYEKVQFAKYVEDKQHDGIQQNALRTLLKMRLWTEKFNQE